MTLPQGPVLSVGVTHLHSSGIIWILLRGLQGARHRTKHAVVEIPGSSHQPVEDTYFFDFVVGETET